MTRKVRRLFTSAAVVAGFGLTAVIARAANYPNSLPSDSGSGLVLVSATDEDPAGTIQPPLRLNDPRSANPTGDPNPRSQSATYPPKKPVASSTGSGQAYSAGSGQALATGSGQGAKKLTAKPAQKTASAASSAGGAQSSAANGQPAALAPRRAAPSALASESFPATAVHRDSHLTAHFAVSEEKPESIKQPETPLPPPTPDASHGEGCCDCEACCCDCPVWCAGLEFMYLRPHFGNDPAFHELTQTTTPGVGVNAGVVVTEDRAVNFDYGYDGDFRFFVGRHLGNGEVRFGYMHIQGEAVAAAEATRGAPANDGIALIGALGNSQLSGVGDFIASSTHLHLNAFDIDRVQNLELQGGFCGSGWNISWSYGVRIVDVHRELAELDHIEATGADNLLDLNSTFVGAGPRIGIESRRNLGGSNFFGFFSADAGLLVGRYRSRARSFFPAAGAAQDTFNIQENTLTRAVPNVEMELGVSWQPSCHTVLTGGWMVESFTDAVASTANTGSCMNCTPNLTNGSGNSLSFDGLFIRLEHCF